MTRTITLTDEQARLLNDLIGNAQDQHHDAEQAGWDFLGEAFETTPEKLDELASTLNAR